jgi:hypothetical protein
MLLVTFPSGLSLLLRRAAIEPTSMSVDAMSRVHLVLNSQ